MTRLDHDLMNANQLLDRHFLEVRAKLLEVAATLDRIDRASANGQSDEGAADAERLEKLRAGIDILRQLETTDRAEQVQRLFSRVYQEDWREQFDI